jgi:hypothetical protein
VLCLHAPGIPRAVPPVDPPGHFVKVLGYGRCMAKGYVSYVECAAYPGTRKPHGFPFYQGCRLENRWGGAVRDMSRAAFVLLVRPWAQACERRRVWDGLS